MVVRSKAVPDHWLSAFCFHLPSMSAQQVLPGELVSVAHPNLKLGPGLLQVASAAGLSGGKASAASSGPIITTRAGTLAHSANNARWWVEGNARRVCSKSDHVYCSGILPSEMRLRYSTCQVRKNRSWAR